MKDNYIHVCFVIDESGSMYSSTDDVIGGFKKTIDEQKKIKDGKCTVSLYTFADNVTEHYLGKDINEVDDFNYRPHDMTALNDGIGRAITNVGKWLDSMPEDEKPSKNLIVVMTDGGENSSKEYTLAQVKDMIKHQTEKYSWEFVYIGTDITSASDANSYGFTNRAFTSRSMMGNSYDVINNATTVYRCCVANANDALTETLSAATANLTAEYETTANVKVTDNN